VFHFKQAEDSGSIISYGHILTQNSATCNF
jgi:hypothetical protein